MFDIYFLPKSDMLTLSKYLISDSYINMCSRFPPPKQWLASQDPTSDSSIFAEIRTLHYKIFNIGQKKDNNYRPILSNIPIYNSCQTTEVQHIAIEKGKLKCFWYQFLIFFSYWCQ